MIFSRNVCLLLLAGSLCEVTGGTLLTGQDTKGRICEEVTFKSPDGLKVYGYLYRPKELGPFPAIVRVHGGIHGQALIRAEDFFVNNRFVVLDVDYRGSDGLGKEYRQKLSMGEKEVDDVVAGGTYLQTLPFVRKDKIGITGDSRGAYITYCAVARPNQPFKVAVAVSGFTDLVKQL